MNASMASAANDVTIYDGSSSFEGGVNSLKVTTIASKRTPNGLARNELAWLCNGQVRDGGISPRDGWQKKGRIWDDNTSLFQGASVYQPDVGNPYIVALIGGRTIQVDVDFVASPVNLTAKFPGTGMPPTQPQGFFAQGELFLIIQAGDNQTLPLFWDGTTLRRSLGLNPAPFTPPSQITLTVTTGWNVPAVGGNVIVTLSANYSGNVGDQIVWANYGTFTVSAITNSSAGPPAVPSSITLTCVSSTVAASTSTHVNTQSLGGGLTETTDTTSENPGALVPPATYTNMAYTPSANVPQPGPTPELPAATEMVYYQGRLWYANNRTVSAGDIVSGPSGTAAYDNLDSILKVTENPLAVGGDGFAVPANAGNIRGLSFLATLDTSLGQGNLIIFTRKEIFSLYVPVDRADWIAASGNNQPLMTVIMRNNGAVNGISIVPYNGDLYFQSLEPAVRSLIAALRYFQQWANPQISANETRILQFVNRALMHFSSGVAFNNRLLQAVVLLNTEQPTNGVVHQAIMPMDFTPLSTLNQQLPPVWEGHYEGLAFLELLEMDFNGLDRMFMIVRSEVDGGIDLWESVVGQTNDNGDNRIEWAIEFPAYTAGDETMLKKLTGAEFWLDSVYGTVNFTLQYRPDGDVCWHQWKSWQICSPRNSCETVDSPVCYPLIPYGESYRSTQTIPVPPDDVCESATGRPPWIGYQFQPKLIIKGYCRIRSITLFMERLERERYKNLVC
jgi:hypothetical protein